MVLALPFVCIMLYQAPSTPLTGIVVGPNSEPVADADVLLGGLPVSDQTVVARGRSDAQGRFTIERPAALAGENRFITPILWVVKPGFRLGSLRFPGPLPKAGEVVRVVLGPPGKGEVRVEDPSGQPVAGARIRLEWFGHERINVPEAVEDLIEATTDKDGRAVIEAAANDEIACVDVHANGFGIQGLPFRPLTSQPKRVRLRQVASLEGRLQADDPAVARGWRVLAYTSTGDRWSTNPQTTGFATGTTNAEGRFAFPVIASGSLQLVVKPPGNLPIMADVAGSLAVSAVGPNSVVVPLRKTVTITGVVRERGHGPARARGRDTRLAGAGRDDPHRHDRRPGSLHGLQPARKVACLPVQTAAGADPSTRPALARDHGIRGPGAGRAEAMGGRPRRSTTPLHRARRKRPAGGARPYHRPVRVALHAGNDRRRRRVRRPRAHAGQRGIDRSPTG